MRRIENGDSALDDECNLEWDRRRMRSCNTRSLAPSDGQKGDVDDWLAEVETRIRLVQIRCGTLRPSYTQYATTEAFEPNNIIVVPPVLRHARPLSPWRNLREESVSESSFGTQASVLSLPDSHAYLLPHHPATSRTMKTANKLERSWSDAGKRIQKARMLC